MLADTDQIQRMDTIQVILLFFEIMTGVVFVMIIYDDEVETVKMVMGDDIL